VANPAPSLPVFLVRVRCSFARVLLGGCFGLATYFASRDPAIDRSSFEADATAATADMVIAMPGTLDAPRIRS
jgi:hypothetical protein